MSARNRQCDCGSGKRFKHCCGLISDERAARQEDAFTYADRGLFPPQYRGQGMQRFCEDLPAGQGLPIAWSPPGLAVVQNFLSAAQCNELVDFLSKQPSADATVKGINPSSGEVDVRVDQQRITKAVHLGEMRETVIKYVALAFRDVAVPYFQAQLDTFSMPSALKYQPGGKFDLHADSEHWSASERNWIRSQNRDYSLLLYLNEGYDGGAISFPNFNIEIDPQQGMLLLFPSDHRFMHAAQSLISGERYVIVSWGLDKRSTKI